jgi:hypothetical protein
MAFLGAAKFLNFAHAGMALFVLRAQIISVEAHRLGTGDMTSAPKCEQQQGGFIKPNIVAREPRDMAA